MPYMRKLDSKRKVALSNVTSDPLTLSLFFPGPAKPCCLSSDTLTTYTLTGLAEALERYNQTGRTLLHFELSASGLIDLVKAEASIEFEETVMVEKSVPDLDAPPPGAQHLDCTKGCSGPRATQSNWSGRQMLLQCA
jgi:hypothetical protein